MFSLDGRSIGDAWYYEAGDAVHVYFLTKPEGSDAGLDIGHAVSRDLVDWEFLGPALERGAPGSWDDRNLATGSVIRRVGSYWMAFTGHYIRTVANDNTVRFEGTTMQLLPDGHRASYARANVHVQERLDGSIVVAYQGRTLAAVPAPDGPVQLRARNGRRPNGHLPSDLAAADYNGTLTRPADAERRNGAKAQQGDTPLPQSHQTPRPHNKTNPGGECD